jgi:O-acetyl-ADP-ribose deacetylase
LSVTLVLGDITNQATDAIVNAANSRLLPGGGVSGAIHAAAGPELEEACSAYVHTNGTVPAGSAAMTRGFQLPARFVIHAVGPVWHGGDSGEDESLASAYETSIALADTAGLETIAFPSISTGIYGYPVHLAAPVALAAVRAALGRAVRMREALFVLHDGRAYSAYKAALGGTSSD